MPATTKPLFATARRCLSAGRSGICEWLVRKLAGGRKCGGFPIIPPEQTVPLSVLPPSPEYLIVPVARVAAMLAML